MFYATIIYFATIFVIYIDCKQTLFIGAMTPTHQPDKYCFESAMNAAMDLINKDERILKNYKLVLQYTRPANNAVALRNYFSLARKQKDHIQLLLGPPYSSFMFAIAKLATMDNIPQISYAALDNFGFLRKNGTKPFPYLVRTTPVVHFFTLAYVSIMKQFKWKRVSIVYEPKIYFSRARLLSIELEKENINILSMTPFSYDIDDVTNQVETILDTIQALDSRILVLMMNTDNLRRIFCEMYRRKIYGPKYQIIIGHGVVPDWFKTDDSILTTNWLLARNCTNDVLLNVGEGFLELARSPLRQDGEKTISGLTSAEGWNLIRNYKDQVWKSAILKRNKNATNIITPDSEYFLDSTYGFDSVYLAAVALNKILPEIPLNITHKPSKEMTTDLTNAMMEVNFEGLTGPIVFDKSIGERYASLLVLQFQVTKTYDYTTGQFNLTGGRQKNVAKFDPQNRKLQFFHDEDGLDLFKNGKIPLDGIYTTKILTSYSSSLVSVMWALASAGILMSLFFLLVNVLYRKEKMIKMSSPNVNNGIVIGCLLCYSSIFVYGLNENFLEKAKIKYACNAFVLLISIGFTFSFGCLFSKTWRIYKIFTASKTLNRVRIQDHHLFGTVFLLLLIDVSLFVIWMILSPFLIAERKYKEELNGEELKEYYYLQCDCKYQLHFTIVMFVYKGLLLMFGLFLAWETKKVKVAVLNDSKMIGMAIYNVAVVATIGAIGAFALYPTTFYSAGYIIVTVTIILTTTVTLVLVFLTKVRILFSASYLTRSRAASSLSFAGNSKQLGNRLSTMSTVNHPPKYEDHSFENRSIKTDRRSLEYKNSYHL